MMQCTCTGCPPAIHRIVAHWWQEKALASGEPYEPCTNGEEEGWCCLCPDNATQEDLLCDSCRDRGGISYLNQDRIREFLLSGKAQVRGLPGTVVIL
jgi:hypothetical protein